MPEQDGRIRCRYCGSNNFAGTTICWQCNRPLLISQTQPEQASLLSPQPSAFVDPSPLPSFSRPVDTSVAEKAAISLGLLLPLIGYPVGIVFLMLDDPRKAQLGRLTLLWSTIGMVISLILSFVIAAPLMSIGSKLMPNSDSITRQLSAPTDGS